MQKYMQVNKTTTQFKTVISCYAQGPENKKAMLDTTNAFKTLQLSNPTNLKYMLVRS